MSEGTCIEHERRDCAPCRRAETFGPPTVRVAEPKRVLDDAQLGRAIAGGVEAIHPRGATVDEMTFTLRRLGVDVGVERVRSVLNWLVVDGALEHVERDDVARTPGRVNFWYRAKKGERR